MKIAISVSVLSILSLGFCSALIGLVTNPWPAQNQTSFNLLQHVPFPIIYAMTSNVLHRQDMNRSLGANPDDPTTVPIPNDANHFLRLHDYSTPFLPSNLVTAFIIDAMDNAASIMERGGHSPHDPIPNNQFKFQNKNHVRIEVAKAPKWVLPMTFHGLDSLFQALAIWVGRWPASGRGIPETEMDFFFLGGSVIATGNLEYILTRR